jgi:twitching motility protein PilT
MALLNMQSLLSEVIKQNASDLHFTVGLVPAMRIDGELYNMSEIDPLSVKDVDTLINSIVTPEQRKKLEKNRELDFSFTFKSPGGDSARFRGNCYYQLGNLGTALRMIPSNVRSTKQLLLPSFLDEIATRRRGLFLVTGPTGHGKSTTLAAIIQQINLSRGTHIITVEDPIEYLFKSEKSIIHQREVGSDTYSFSEALKRALRQDPDVIMIGEMRDLETIAAAITAAETGHLVLATLHTADAAQTVDRIIDVFPPYQQQQIRQQLSNILIAICSQQLIPLPGEGRIVATELLVANPAIRNCIRESKTGQIKSLLQTGSESMMHSMDQDLARLVKEQKLPFDLVMKYAYDPKDLQRIVFEANLV